jgi:hypothetical protein
MMSRICRGSAGCLLADGYILPHASARAMQAAESATIGR